MALPRGISLILFLSFKLRRHRADKRTHI